MITGISVIQSSVGTSLSDGVLSRVLHTEGTGMNPRHDITQKAPQEHGATFIDYRLDQRKIDLILMLTGTQAEMETKRRALMGLFHPDFTSVLRFTTTSGTRDIVVQFAGDFTVPSKERLPLFQKIRISLNAYKFFYDPVGVYLQFTLGGGTGAYTVPLAMPFSLGTGTLSQSVAVANAAPEFWRARPLIGITGPLTDAKLANTNTGKVIDFTGNTIAALDTYTVDTRTDAPTVTDAAGTNRIDKVTTSTDLAGFYFPRGTTSLLITGTGATEASLITIQYNPWYLGI
jgi:hypothetical protein